MKVKELKNRITDIKKLTREAKEKNQYQMGKNK